MNWIQKVVQANSENEAPQIFFYWAALAAMSAVVKKNIRLDRQFYMMYPNIYVFIVAKSGMKKGIPVALAKKLVEQTCCTRVISGRNSVPSIIQSLGKAVSLEGGGINKDAQAFIVSGELASLLVKDPDGLTILTDLHNTHEHEKEWINTLKSTGTDKLQAPCITILGATNEDHFIDTVPQADVKGGFIARTFIVYSSDRGAPNPLTDPPKQIVNVGDLALYLKELSKIKGDFKWSEQAKLYYSDWYKSMMADFPDEPTGTFGRIGDQVAKVAMLLSLANDFDLILTEDCVHESKVVCYRCADGMRQVTMGSGKSTYASQTKIVLRELISAPTHKMERKRLLAKWWGDLDGPTLDIIIETLLGADAINVYRQGSNCIYELKRNALDDYIKFTRKIQ